MQGIPKRCIAGSVEPNHIPLNQNATDVSIEHKVNP